MADQVTPEDVIAAAKLMKLEVLSAELKTNLSWSWFAEDDEGGGPKTYTGSFRLTVTHVHKGRVAITERQADSLPALLEKVNHG